MHLLGKSYSADEKRTFNLHLSYSILEGFTMGVLALNEFVFIKSLNGTNYQLGLLFQFSVVVFIFLVLINEFIKRAKNKKKLLRWTGILTRGPLFLLLLFPDDNALLTSGNTYHYIFLFLFLIYFFGNTVIFPLINLFLKNQYSHDKFGKLYGYASSANKIVMLAATFGYGLLLDWDQHAYTYVFPFVAMLGIFSAYLLSNINYSDPGQEFIHQGFFTSIRKSFTTMTSILKKNKSYLHFEVGFMLYGFSFMITSVVITIFLERALHLNYSSVAFYKNAYNILAIVLLPYTGKLLGKMDPRKFAIITFGSLMLYILFMLLTEHIPLKTEFLGIEMYLMLIIAYLFYGVFAATMALLWFIGSAYFCKPQEAADYQSVHLSLTAVRGMFAPLLGVFFYELMGFTGTFSLAIISLLAGIFVLTWSYKKESRTT